MSAQVIGLEVVTALVPGVLRTPRGSFAPGPAPYKAAASKVEEQAILIRLIKYSSSGTLPVLWISSWRETMTWAAIRLGFKTVPTRLGSPGVTAPISGCQRFAERSEV